jgi:hypothetical protein
LYITVCMYHILHIISIIHVYVCMHTHTPTYPESVRERMRHTNPQTPNLSPHTPTHTNRQPTGDTGPRVCGDIRAFLRDSQLISNSPGPLTVCLSAKTHVSSSSWAIDSLSATVLSGTVYPQQCTTVYLEAYSNVCGMSTPPRSSAAKGRAGVCARRYTVIVISLPGRGPECLTQSGECLTQSV